MKPFNELLWTRNWEILFQLQCSRYSIYLKSFYRTTGLYRFLTILKKIRLQWKSDESYSHRLASRKIHLWIVVISCLRLQSPSPLLVKVAWFSFQEILSLLMCHCDLLQECSQLSGHSDCLKMIFHPSWQILEILWKRSMLFLLNSQRRSCKVTKRKEARETLNQEFDNILWVYGSCLKLLQNFTSESTFYRSSCIPIFAKANVTSVFQHLWHKVFSLSVI